MTRLLLLLILGGVTTYYLPDSRLWVANITQPLWVPAVKWNTREEMKQVGSDVVAHERTTGSLPARREWLEWLDYRYAGEEMKMDSWGTVYELQVWSDSIGIASYGPDRIRSTEDDFYVATVRERDRRRR